VNLGPKTEGVLYHYTSHDTLYNIVEGKCLRASHVYYMNDSSEIKYAIDRFIHIVKNRRATTADKQDLDFLEQFPAWLQNMRNNPHYIFLFSLSEKGNLLSQWRAYTPHGTGISIGFNQSDIKGLAQKQGLRLLKCIYDHNEQESLLTGALHSVLSTFQADKSNLDISKTPKGQEYHMYLNQFSDYLLREFIRIKDSVFHEECEWRLVSKFYERYVHEDINFRSGSTTLVPYINYDISNIRTDGELFEQVYCGPSPNFDLAFSAISAYLSKTKACKMLINSQQPFRVV
jgi:hypothetical protein